MSKGDLAVEVQIQEPTPKEKTVELSDGRKATVRRGNGKVVRLATRHAKGDESLMTHAMLSLCVEINDPSGPVHLTPEDLDEVDAEDYLILMGAWSEVNFRQAK